MCSCHKPTSQKYGNFESDSGSTTARSVNFSNVIPTTVDRRFNCHVETSTSYGHEDMLPGTLFTSVPNALDEEHNISSDGNKSTEIHIGNYHVQNVLNHPTAEYSLFGNSAPVEKGVDESDTFVPVLNDANVNTESQSRGVNSSEINCFTVPSSYRKTNSCTAAFQNQSADLQVEAQVKFQPFFQSFQDNGSAFEQEHAHPPSPQMDTVHHLIHPMNFEPSIEMFVSSPRQIPQISPPGQTVSFENSSIPCVIQLITPKEDFEKETRYSSFIADTVYEISNPSISHTETGTKIDGRQENLKYTGPDFNRNRHSTEVTSQPQTFKLSECLSSPVVYRPPEFPTPDLFKAKIGPQNTEMAQRINDHNHKTCRHSHGSYDVENDHVSIQTAISVIEEVSSHVSNSQSMSYGDETQHSVQSRSMLANEVHGRGVVSQAILMWSLDNSQHSSSRRVESNLVHDATTNLSWKNWISENFEVSSNVLERKEHMIVGLARILQSSCNINSSAIGAGSETTVECLRLTHMLDESAALFYSQWPKSTVLDLVSFIINALPVSESVFIMAVVYMRRVFDSDDAMAVNHLNIHRILVVAILLAQKFQEDESWWNSKFVQLGLIQSVEEINSLEVEFLRRIDFRLYVELNEYREFEKAIFG